MKHFSIFIFFLVFLSLPLITVKPLAAQEPQAPNSAATPTTTPQAAAQRAGATIRIAVIDVETIRRSALVVKDIRTQIKSRLDGFQADVAKDEKELRAAQQELKRQETILSPDAYEEKRQNFSKRVTEVQLLVQKRKQYLAMAQTTAMKKVEVIINKIINKLVGENTLDLVLRRDPVVFFNKRLDLTNLVLENLDKELPSLKINKMEK